MSNAELLDNTIYLAAEGDLDPNNIDSDLVLLQQYRLELESRLNEYKQLKLKKLHERIDTISESMFARASDFKEAAVKIAEEIKETEDL